MPEIKYDITIAPTPPDITMSMSIAGNKFIVKEESYNMTVTVTPAADAIVNDKLDTSIFGHFLTMGAEILNAFDGAALLTNIGNGAATAVNCEIGKQLKDKKFEIEIGTSLTHNFKIEEVPVTLSASGLELTDSGGCMLLCGNLVLT